MSAPPSFMVSALAALLRHGLTAMGAMLVEYGLADKDQATQITTVLVGLAPILASIAWSWAEKHNKLGFIQDLFQMAAVPQSTAMMQTPLAPTSIDKAGT